MEDDWRAVGVAFQLIIVLSSINLILPTLTLYSLSMSDFGRHLENVISVKVAYQLLHLLVINIPFLGVRIYLWYDDASLDCLCYFEYLA